MVPTAVGAHLDHVALAHRLPGGKAIHLPVGGDTPATLGQSRTEDVGDLDERLRLADRAGTTHRCAAELRISLQFTLAVTDLLTRQRSLAPSREDGLTSQAVVDATAAAGFLQADLGSSNHSKDSTPPSSAPSVRPD